MIKVSENGPVLFLSARWKGLKCTLDLCNEPGNISSLGRWMCNLRDCERRIGLIDAVDHHKSAFGKQANRRVLEVSDIINKVSQGARRKRAERAVLLTAWSKLSLTVSSRSSKQKSPSGFLVSSPKSRKRLPCLPRRFLMDVSCSERKEQCKLSISMT